MKRGILVSFAFLLVSLALAFYASLDGNKSADADITWARIGAGEFEKLIYSGKDADVTITPDGSNGFWVEYTSHEANGRKERFKGNDKVEKLVTSLNPFVIKRALGGVAELKLEEYSLHDHSGGSLQIMAKGKTVIDFKLGRRAFGSQDIYALDVGKNTVVSMAGGIVEDLRGAATRFYLREVFRYKDQEISQVDVSKDGESVFAMRAEKVGADETKWVDTRTGEASEAFGNWFSKARNLKIEHYATEEITQSLRAAKPLLTIAVASPSKRLDEVAIQKLDGPLTIQGKEYQTTWWLTSSALGAAVMVNAQKAETLVKEAGADSPAPATPVEASPAPEAAVTPGDSTEPSTP